jgi:transketolase
MEKNQLDELCINTLRFLAADAVQVAQSGHPGTAMGAAPTVFVLWKEFLKHSPNNSAWVDRDRFVLSSGHASMLLYGLLHLFGYPITIEDLKNFRQLGSKTPGHPEYRHVPGVETTSGPLGQGIANAVGMALAEAHLADRYNRPDVAKIVDHYTYVLASDGDLMEGVSAESASLAGHLGLGKLIVLYDDNQVTIDGPTSLAFSEDVLQRFAAYGWHTQRVEDVLVLDDIRQAITSAQQETDRPSIIAIRSVIGYGAQEIQGTCNAHYGALGEEQLYKAKEGLGWPGEAMFLVPPEVQEYLKSESKKGEELAAAWEGKFVQYKERYSQEAKEFLQVHQSDFDPDLIGTQPKFYPEDGPLPTRLANPLVINDLAMKIPQLISGCADLNPATQTFIKESQAISKENYAGRNIHFGIREHAMGSITNGMVLHGGIRAFTATFLVFSDYMRPSIRMAALMKLPVISVFTHDSIGVGEDGPTHQPVEQLMSLRLIPNLSVIRPCDANEVAQAWAVALKNTSGPTSILLTRQPLPILDPNSQVRDGMVEKGAYILSESVGGFPQLILIASGSEVHLALKVQSVLEGERVPTRVVSMPSWELFAGQSKVYQDAVLPPEITNRMAIEAGATSGWEKWIGEKGVVFGIDRFGASAPGNILFETYGFTTENICRIIREEILFPTVGGRNR